MTLKTAPAMRVSLFRGIRLLPVLAFLLAGLAVLTPRAASAQSAQSVAEANMRAERVEEQMRQMTGQMEQMMFQIRQMQEQLRRTQEDTEYRLRQLEGSGSGQRSEASPPSVPALASPPALASAPPAAPLPQTDPAYGGTQVLGQIPAGAMGASSAVPGVGAPGPLDLSALTRPGALDLPGAQSGAPSAQPVQPGTRMVMAPSSDPRDSYDLAYGYILHGDYALAEQGFRDFLARNPADPLSPSATFWLGEALFGQGNYTDAADTYLKVYNSYPNDPKVPDAMLKLAMSLNQLGVRDQACATFAKVIADYPNASRAVRQTADTERQRAGCS